MPKYTETKCLHCGKLKRVANGSGKYCSNACTIAWQFENKALPAFERGEIDPQQNLKLMRKCLVHKYGHKCSKCENTEWNSEPIPLDVDHINGDNKNHKPENLRLICPNCHRQTKTWGNSKFQRSKKYASLAHR